MVTTSPANSPYVMTRPQSLFHKAVMGGVYTDVLFCAGRGAGKTTAGARQIIRLALERPGTRWIIVAPTYPMLRDVDIYEVMRWLPPAYIRSYNRTEHLLTLTTGSEIAFRSADNADSLRGANRDGAWFDEPRNLKSRDAFDIVSAQLRPNRLLFMTTTPAGIFHWLYDLFVANPITHSTVIYGKTADNFHLPPEYEARLRVQYTGKFAQQELDALWTSFEGLVYDNFSVATDGNVSDTAEYNPDLPILIGVDDGYAEGDGVGTASYHPRVIVLGQATAQGGLNIFAEYVTTNELPESSIRRVLEAYPKPQAAYVDSSAADIRMLLAGMGIYVVPATHKVSEGIKFVRRLLCDGNNVRLIKIHPRCKHLIRELQTYRYDDRMRSVSAGELPPLKLDDHSCLVAGTKIATMYGDVSIEHIKQGDYVLTRQGYQPVLASAKTCHAANVMTIELANGMRLTGTANHPVYVEGAGYIALRALRYGDKILVSKNHTGVLCQSEQQNRLIGLFTEGLNFADTLRQRGIATGRIIARTLYTSAKESKPYIVKSGKTTMGLFLTGIIYTTETATQATTILPIWNVSPKPSIYVSMLNWFGETLKNLLSYVIEWITPDNMQANGMVQKKGVNGTSKSVFFRGKAQSLSRTLASSAARLLKQMRVKALNSARTIARPQHGGQAGLTMNRGYVLLAAKHIESIAIASNNFVVSPVVSVINEREKRAVYNLSVAQANEYVANGVLTHNCDALRYLCQYFKGRMQVK